MSGGFLSRGLLRLRSLLSHPVKFGWAIVGAIVLCFIVNSAFRITLVQNAAANGGVRAGFTHNNNQLSSSSYVPSTPMSSRQRPHVLLSRLQEAATSLSEAAALLRNASIATISSSKGADPRPRAVLTMLTAGYCLPVSVLWKSLRARETDRQIIFAIMIPQSEDLEKIQTDKDCALFLGGAENSRDPFIELIRIGKEELPAGAGIGRSNWAVSMDKMQSFGFTQYSQILLMDADTVLLTHTDTWFELLEGDTVDFAGAVDQFDGCTRREVLNK